MRSYERLGSSDPHAEGAAESAQKETLETIKERLGEEEYREIIASLVRGDVENLPPHLREVINTIKEEQKRSAY